MAEHALYQPGATVLARARFGDTDCVSVEHTLDSGPRAKTQFVPHGDGNGDLPFARKSHVRPRCR